MKFLPIIATLAATASALPRDEFAGHEEEIKSWEIYDTHPDFIKAKSVTIFSNELLDGDSSQCPTAIWIWARGSTEQGNMGFLGPVTANALEAHYGDENIWIQGVGWPYTASLIPNLLPDGSTQAAINEMRNLLILADAKCPSSKIVAGGYSQGAALAAAAVRDSTPAIRDRISGVVLFGYTKNQQYGGGIPNFPQDKVKVICAPLDLVCNGTLIVVPPHLTYLDEAATEAPEFLISKIDG